LQSTGITTTTILLQTPCTNTNPSLTKLSKGRKCKEDDRDLGRRKSGREEEGMKGGREE
jgi:hypothetical protein